MTGVVASDRLEPFLAKRVASEPAWLVAIRREAAGRFAERGLPGRRVEDWKYTSLAALGEIPLAGELPDDRGAGFTLARALQAAGLSDWDGPVAVFVDGRLIPGASRLGNLPAGMQVASLSDRLSDPAVMDLLMRPLRADDGLADLVTALALDGAVVQVADRTVSKRPLLLLFLSMPGSAPAAVHFRNLFLCGKQSQVHITEVHAALDRLEAPGGNGLHADVARAAHLHNSLGQFQLDEGAIVTHTVLQREDPACVHVERLQAEVGKDASWTSNALSVGAKLARWDLHASLASDGAQATLNGLYLVADRQHVDFHTTIDHASPHTTSRELYKGLLDGAATGVFDGKVLVREGAIKAAARQTNRNLLLSETAQINTKPQLEIFADDVKCSHGATIGQLDAAALFYLQSRGVSADDARRLLMYAFASEVLASVPEQLAGVLSGILLERLPAQGDLQEVSR